MHLLINFLSSAMLVHNKYVDAHALSFMNVVSLCGVDDDIQQLYESILFSSTL
jgi:hypothetical protein